MGPTVPVRRDPLLFAVPASRPCLCIMGILPDCGTSRTSFARSCPDSVPAFSTGARQWKSSQRRSVMDTWGICRFRSNMKPPVSPLQWMEQVWFSGVAIPTGKRKGSRVSGAWMKLIRSTWRSEFSAPVSAPFTLSRSSFRRLDHFRPGPRFRCADSRSPTTSRKAGRANWLQGVQRQGRHPLERRHRRHVLAHFTGAPECQRLEPGRMTGRALAISGTERDSRPAVTGRPAVPPARLPADRRSAPRGHAPPAASRISTRPSLS